MRMLDYVMLTQDRLRQNVEHAHQLVEALVGVVSCTPCSALRLVASGSSRHAALCARHFMEDMLGKQVLVVTPEAFITHEHQFPTDAYTLVISQSGFSTNSIAALDFMRSRGESPCVLTANAAAPITQHADAVFDFGVGAESVDFVTMGVQALMVFLMLFALFLGHKSRLITGQRMERELKNLREVIDGYSSAVLASKQFAQDERLGIARHAPVCFIGNGSCYGVAQEGALKFNECLKTPSMYFEGEEFVHGPHMQLTPDSLIFIMDDPEGSPRLASLHNMFLQITSSAYFITGHPSGGSCELAVPAVPNPHMAAIPSLAAIQYLAAQKMEELERREMHPYVRALREEIGSKAHGYDEAINKLEQAARVEFGM
ncbi:SIS domain-containing protein [Collinsella sp. AGMB00827]|uniref:SIS domain-containing protein n=1 Tax=Collinsella ureilytica TaxID=2869515 RepID=A0ABS7MKG1_9ACTN|nr:SIS domain-containing protein [Collinsella urealyticum]MBY4797859.1 SIS domain-containing protein [Collinsella urealyticum]